MTINPIRRARQRARRDALLDAVAYLRSTARGYRANAAARRARKHRAPRGQRRPYLDERTEAWHV